MWVVYTLHFHRPVNGESHYIGIANLGRLHARLVEHRNAYGAIATRAALRVNVPWHLSHVKLTTDRDLERRYQAMPDRARPCQTCRGLPPRHVCRAPKRAARAGDGPLEF